MILGHQLKLHMSAQQIEQNLRLACYYKNSADMVLLVLYSTSDGSLQPRPGKVIWVQFPVGSISSCSYAPIIVQEEHAGGRVQKPLQRCVVTIGMKHIRKISPVLSPYVLGVFGMLYVYMLLTIRAEFITLANMLLP